MTKHRTKSLYAKGATVLVIMAWILSFFLTIVLSSFLTSEEAGAQTVCGKHGNILEQLSQRFGEAPAALGMMNKTNSNAVSAGNVLELLISPSGSWTILVTKPGGTTCVVANGENWTALPKAPAGPVT